MKGRKPRKLTPYGRDNPETFSYQGKEVTIRELSEATGLTVDTLRYRIKARGMTVEDALAEDSQQPDIPPPPPPIPDESEMITHNGETRSINEWADLLGIPRATLRQRHKVLKWSPEESLKPQKRKAKPQRLLTPMTPEGPVTKSMTEWSEDRRIPISTISRRLGLGWTETQALDFAPGPRATKKEPNSNA